MVADTKEVLRSVRWAGALQNLLGENYEVISEGLSGRTFVAPDLEKPYRTGITHLKSILTSHLPIDAVVVMLGTNDVKEMYHLTAPDIASHLEQTINLIQADKINEILVICPPDIIFPEGDDLDPKYTDNSLKKIKELPLLFKKVAEKYKCHFINAQDYITSSKLDGFHFDPTAHRKLAEVVANEIVNMGL